MLSLMNEQLLTFSSTVLKLSLSVPNFSTKTVNAASVGSPTLVKES